MNIEACYNKMGADYAEVKSRAVSHATPLSSVLH